MHRGFPFAPLALAASLVLAGCCERDRPPVVPAPDAAAGDTPQETRALQVVEERFVSAMTPEDNIDSPASWTTPDGAVWVFATAKSTDRLVVYDGDTGETLRHVGARGTGDGEFVRPNGIAVADDLLFVVERDNRRVQVFALPGLEHRATFGADELVKPYGLWVQRTDEGHELYVTDSYETDAGEVPPLAELDRRVHRYALLADGDALRAEHRGHFGDTGEAGALRVVESIWGDPAHDRLLIAEEDESYANELKVYTLDGRFAGVTVGGDVFQAQAEGIALRECGDGGWWLTTEQGKESTVFHLFDRASLAHVGAVTGAKVANTDGIWLGGPSRAFPDGVLYAVHDDQGLVAFDWRDIAAALDLPACPAA
ncbi:phytase [Coralloluteibacterium thermophilus]|uniref:Phytase n=1 Tax=Coralloluteibacterium thermophilum TaxID=2707049 RepID=A0ABV9NNF3_9GAMM